MKEKILLSSSSPSENTSITFLAFCLIYIGDFVSFYLAILNGIDPTPV
ncbi:MAG: hypothetical protein GH155_04485, partial [Spirochaeta sp.]|nr:hypothetical protein [Spirochaeta sp.]